MYQKFLIVALALVCLAAVFASAFPEPDPKAGPFPHRGGWGGHHHWGGRWGGHHWGGHWGHRPWGPFTYGR